MNPWVLRYVIDGLTVGVPARRLLFYAGLIVGLSVVQGFFRFWMRKLMIGASRKIEYDLRNDYFAHIQTLPVQYFRNTPTGDLMARATNDLDAVRMLLGPGVMYFFDTVILFFAALAFMLTINVKLTLFGLLPLPVLTLMVNRIASTVHHRFRDIQEQYGHLNTKVQENLSGIRVIKAYVREQSEIESFRTVNEEYVRRNRILIHIRSLFFPLMMTLSGASFIIVLWLGGRQVIGGQITLGDFVAFGGYLMMLTFPMMMLGWVVDLFQRGSASMKRIQRVLNEPPFLRNDGVLSEVPIQGAIEFSNVSFSYNEDGPPVLKDIHLKIEQGTTLAIVGRTGSGKSTLANLIPRLLEATAGEIRIDGVPIQNIPLHQLRASIGYVPQDPFLFSDSLWENIAYGVEDVTEEQIREAARISRIQKDVEDFPQRFETLVGERGVTLSGGQKQRATISRAIIRNPKILILDDALSSVDTHTEEEILNHLKGVMRNRTSIIVAHRISTVRDADWIIVLDDGRIVEQGKHEDLVALGGIYADLYHRQQLTEELERM